MWTTRAWKKGDLILPAESNEIKDRYYTLNRSALCPSGSDYHPSKKHVVMDGRLRANFDRGGVALFWLVTRKPADDEADKREANMALGSAQVTMDVKIELNMPGRARSAKAQPEVPEIPILYNVKAVPAHTMLLCLQDDGISKVVKEQQELKKKEPPKWRMAKMA